MSVVVTDIERASARDVAALGAFSVATLYEASGRTGLLGSHLRPIYRPVHIAGPAITCEPPAGDNWMVHVAVEQCKPGDVLVIAPSAPCEDGYLGDLLAASLKARGVVGVIIEAGVRDVANLTEMNFPVWSKSVSARGTVKAALGNVNLPITCAGVLIQPGDVIVADDDGVVALSKYRAAEIALRAGEREDNEGLKRKQFEAGVLGLDLYGMRPKLIEAGLRYVAQKNLK